MSDYITKALSADGIELFEIDFHYQIDGTGSKDEYTK